MEIQGYKSGSTNETQEKHAVKENKHLIISQIAYFLGDTKHVFPVKI